MAEYYYVDEAFIREFLRMRHWIDTFNGAHVTNTGKTCSVGAPPPPPLPQVLAERLVKVRITAAADGYGKYLGRIIEGAVQPAEQGWAGLPVIVPDAGQAVPDADNCHVENIAEEFKDTHLLAPTETTQVHHVGFRLGYHHFDGKPIVVVNVDRLPRPQFQYDVVQAVVQNRLGCATPKAHPAR